MRRDDRYGLAGVLLCGVVGWFDHDWQAFWYGAGLVLAAWTVWSLTRPDPN